MKGDSEKYEQFLLDVTISRVFVKSNSKDNFEFTKNSDYFLNGYMLGWPKKYL